MRLDVGTSGYAYKEWKGSFYPEDCKPDGYLRFYARQLSTVEINNTFYRMPSERVLRQWAEDVPEDFTFVLKAPMRITHRARLKEVDSDVEYFLRVASALEGRLGPILVQLPPNMRKDVPRLAALLELVAGRARVAVEFRHASWLDDEVYDVLRRHGAALCIAEADPEESELRTPEVATAPFGYLRLRKTRYAEGELAAWIERIREKPWSRAFVFFKHEDAGSGPRLARELVQMWQASDAGATPARTPARIERTEAEPAARPRPARRARGGTRPA